MTPLRLGTRKSALAKAQAEGVASALRAAFPNLAVELVLMTTSGDQMPDHPHPPPPSPLSMEKGRGPSPYLRERAGIPGEGGLKALFTKELDEALLAGRIDFSVHSMKDLAGELPPGLVIAAVPERDDPRDVWISRDKTPFAALAKGAKVGTGAVRRQAQLKLARPDLEVVPLRGNVDTRLRKLGEGDLDGIILALAGLNRLGRAAEATETLPAESWLPAVGQGCLAIEMRKNDTKTGDYLKKLDHAPSHTAALSERAYLAALGGSCQTPIAAHASIKGDVLTIAGLVASPNGERAYRDAESGPARDTEIIGTRLAKKLLAAGAGRILGL